MENSATNKFSKVFASHTEKFVCALGNSLVENFLLSGTLSKGFAILSDKRVYFKGKVFTRRGKGFTVTNEERVVDVKDVTGTGFVHQKHTSVLIFGIVALVVAAIAFLLSMPDNEWRYLWDITVSADTLQGVAVLTGAIGIASIVMYFVSRGTLFEITFAGGAISFDTRLINQQEIQTFQRNIRLAKDAAEERQHQPSTVAAPIATVTATAEESLADKLKSYKDLYDSGAISETEYNEIKAKLLAKV